MSILSFSRIHDKFQRYTEKFCQKGQDVIAMVTDSCPSCSQSGDIDLSYAAWDDVTGNDAHSRFDGSWEFVPCPDHFLSGNTKLSLKSGSSMWWLAVQVVNFRNKIEKIQIKHKVKLFEILNSALDSFADICRIKL